MELQWEMMLVRALMITVSKVLVEIGLNRIK